MEQRECSFCKRKIEPGTGKMFAKKDGNVLYFCGSKCENNMLKLKRIPRRVKWVTKRKE